MSETKQIPCASPSCKGRRKHFESEEPRGVQFVTVPQDYEGVAFCSLECSLYYPREMGGSTDG